MLTSFVFCLKETNLHHFLCHTHSVITFRGNSHTLPRAKFIEEHSKSSRTAGASFANEIRCSETHDLFFDRIKFEFHKITRWGTKDCTKVNVTEEKLGSAGQQQERRRRRKTRKRPRQQKLPQWTCHHHHRRLPWGREGVLPNARHTPPPVQEVETISPAKKAKQEAGSKANMERAANSLSMKDNELLWFQHLRHNTQSRQGEALTKREIRLVLTMVQDKYMRKLKRQKQRVMPQMKERLWEECSRKYIKSTQWGYEQQSRMRKLFKEYYEKRPYTRDACDTRTTERK